MFELRVQEEFAAAHNLRHYEGKCENLHGHNWTVELRVRGTRLQEDTEMLVDFKVLKTILRDILETLDHCYLNEIEPFDRINPTSENIARLIAERAQGALDDQGIRNASVWSVEVFETPRASATWFAS